MKKLNEGQKALKTDETLHKDQAPLSLPNNDREYYDLSDGLQHIGFLLEC